MESDYEVAGVTIPHWHADFHWSVATEENTYADVYVVATDLNVAEPLQRAQSIMAFSLDTRRQPSDNGIRVVMEANNENVQATEAAKFLRHHSMSLPYKVFDFGSESERSEFFDTSVMEILGDAGAGWRDIWTNRRAAEGWILVEHPT